MNYKTSGTVSSVKWTKDSSDPSKSILSFKIEPVSPYAFERKNKADTEKFVLWDVDDSTTPIVKVPVTTEYVATFGDSSLSFAALLLLKQNRTKIELECENVSHSSTSASTSSTPASTSSTTLPSHPIPISKLSVVG